MKSFKLFILGVFLVLLFVPGQAQMTLVEDEETGSLTIKDGGKDVLTYRFKDQLIEGRDSRFTRSCYIHPLYSLDREVLTEDFPEDHAHHYGLFWTWPDIKTRGQETETWHPSNLRQHFDRWLLREARRDRATLSVENIWKLDGEEVVAKETVTLSVFRADDTGRAIDVELSIQADSGPLLLRGSKEPEKNYGGLSIRGAPMFKGAVLTTDLGVQGGDANNTKFLWADMSTEECGVAIFLSPEHPDFPTVWCLRNSYAGFLNPSWPGAGAAILRAGMPVTLCYRIYIHRGNAEEANIAEIYEDYLSGYKKDTSEME
jgi:hypothetical protein